MLFCLDMYAVCETANPFLWLNVVALLSTCMLPMSLSGAYKQLMLLFHHLYAYYL